MLQDDLPLGMDVFIIVPWLKEPLYVSLPLDLISLEHTSLWVLSDKTTMLLALTSTKRVSELTAHP